MSEDVQFEIQDETVITASAAYLTVFSKVTGCIVNIKSAKKDAAGRGHRYYFAKSNPAKKLSYCITWTLWRYVQHARPGPNCPFFHIPKLRWTFKPPYLNKKLREMAEMYGLDPHRVSSYSLRISGATAMAAAEMKEYETQDSVLGTFFLSTVLGTLSQNRCSGTMSLIPFRY